MVTTDPMKRESAAQRTEQAVPVKPEQSREITTNYHLGN